MSENKPPSIEQYEMEISAMLEEAKGLMAGFASLFPDTPVGNLKQLFTLHCMVMEACSRLNVPRDMFGDFTIAMIAAWHASGKPEDFTMQTVVVPKGESN